MIISEANLELPYFQLSLEELEIIEMSQIQQCGIGVQFSDFIQDIFTLHMDGVSLNWDIIKFYI